MSKRFALCINNEDYLVSLAVRKVDDIIPDEVAERHDFIRIIDESGEDYLYHKSHFIFIELPEKDAQALVTA